MKKLDLIVIISINIFIVFVAIFAYLSYPGLSYDESLIVFEDKTFNNFDIVEIVKASSIKSGDVLLSVDIGSFVDVCVNKTIYKTNSESGDSLFYHCFVEGNDGELIQYSVRAHFSVNGWRWMN